jgi:hypothetical protein
MDIFQSIETDFPVNTIVFWLTGFARFNKKPQSARCLTLYIYSKISDQYSGNFYG